MSTPDFTALANRIEELLAEHHVVVDQKRRIVDQERRIQRDLRDALSKIDVEFRAVLQDGPRPTRPRPVEDKLAIAAGRAINAGVKAAWQRDRIKAEAIKAATALSQKYGTTLPPEFTARIDRAIARRLQRSR